MKIIPTDICTTCGIKETVNHLTFSCNRFLNIRAKYKFSNLYNDIRGLLKSQDLKIYEDLISYIKEANIEI